MTHHVCEFNRRLAVEPGVGTASVAPLPASRLGEQFKCLLNCI
jgi:hypothetical protein